MIADEVRVQDPLSKRWDRIGVVVGIGRHRDYHIKMPNGRVYWRNRRFLRLLHPCNSGDLGSPPPAAAGVGDDPETAPPTQRRSDRARRPPNRYRS